MRRKNPDVKIVNGYEIKPNADLREADLRGADLRGVDLHDADLFCADLSEADLRGVNLAGCHLSNTVLDGAHLEGQHLERANLIAANLIAAHLEGAILSEADLSEADLSDAHLEDANLDGANLEIANLTGADLRGADLTRANLSYAKLGGAYLDGTDFKNANLTEAHLEYADLSNAILTGAILANAWTNSRTKFPQGFDRRRLRDGTNISEIKSYGEMTGAVLKLSRPDSPQRAADFKRKYPNEFERLIKDTGGKDFTDSVKESIRNKYRTPFDWYVTRGKYEDYAQRVSKKPNDVILLNIDLERIDATPKQVDLIKKLSLVSNIYEHPHEKIPLYTIGWVRFYEDKEHKTYLVEEVQSDVWAVREQTRKVDEQTKNQLQDAGISPEDFDEVFEVIRPYAERFYEDALGILFMEAEEKGYSVEMLGYGDKKDFKSPRSIYTDLPRKMGMRPQPTQTDLDLKDKVSYYKPNPSRPRRRY